MKERSNKFSNCFKISFSYKKKYYIKVYYIEPEALLELR